jgi:hypothetical protein
MNARAWLLPIQAAAYLTGRSLGAVLRCALTATNRNHPGAQMAPLHALAAALDGTVLGPSSIRVGDNIVSASPAGGLWLGGHAARGIRVGTWNEPTETVAARINAILSEVCS